MSKHYNWMTPEEAEKELKPGEFVWYRYYQDVWPAKFINATTAFLEFEVLADEESDWVLLSWPEKCICRAFVPEVPI